MLHGTAGFTKCTQDFGGEREGNLDDLGVDGGYYNATYRNRLEERKLTSSGSGYGQAAGCCERGIETAGSVRWRESVDWVRN